MATLSHCLTSKLHMVNALKKKSSAILYHYPCPDGAFAALAAHLYFKATSCPALFFPNTVYRPLRFLSLLLSTFLSKVYFFLTSNFIIYFFPLKNALFQSWRSSSAWYWWSLPSGFRGSIWVCTGNLLQSWEVQFITHCLFMNDIVIYYCF